MIVCVAVIFLRALRGLPAVSFDTAKVLIFITEVLKTSLRGAKRRNNPSLDCFATLATTTFDSD